MITKRIFLAATVILAVCTYGQKVITAEDISQSGILKTKTSDSTQTIAPATQTKENKLEIATLDNESKYSYSPKQSKKSKKEYLDALVANKDASQQKRGKQATTADSLHLTRSTTDELGFTHSYYQQYYNGIVVDGATIMIHEKNGVVTHINGNHYKNLMINTVPTISSTKALKLALRELSIPVNQENLKTEGYLIIAPINGVFTTENYRLSYRFALQSSDGEQWDVFIDAHTGALVNKIAKTAHLSVTTSANTLYFGQQTITTYLDDDGKYYLEDSARGIITFDVSNIPFTADTTAKPIKIYPKTIPASSANNDWKLANVLKSIAINTIATNWWYSSFIDEQPDLYIKIVDGTNNVVYTSNYYSNTVPPVSFTGINLALSNPPYTIELWDYDASSNDDFGGSYTLNNTSGMSTFSGKGNTGNANIVTLGSPIVDVHWGLEKTYDFYKTIFNRNSFDGKGSLIKAYVNPKATFSGLPNNAFAMNYPYNIMMFGMGDFVNMKPVVALDVMAHEFTHMVTNYSIFDVNNKPVGLTYQNESGAVNESFSDIFGTCVEFAAKGNKANWTIGEDVSIPCPFLRDMSNPSNSLISSVLWKGEIKNFQQPDTYKGQLWESDIKKDNGGVHANSGVMNYWFYLLSQGGTGTNDLGTQFTVSGIGISKAARIAYRTLTSYEGKDFGFLQTANATIQATEDLYGAQSAEWYAVKQAWFAVGVLSNDPSKFCSGTVKLTEPTGTINDGSGSGNYAPNSSCKWLIKPTGATSITIKFTKFKTEAQYDSVIVYPSISNTWPIKKVFTGSSIPAAFTVSGGACLIEFKTDAMTEYDGWELEYSATTVAGCTGTTYLSTPTGSFTDNSGSGNYGNNLSCVWAIAPAGAKTITLNVTKLDTELNSDGLLVYDSVPDASNLKRRLMGVYTGSTAPAAITSYSGEMYVIFSTDAFITKTGFEANYTSTCTPYCQGVTQLTADAGAVADGSASATYYHNSNCGWLIKPNDAQYIQLDFSEFDLESRPINSDSYFDYVEVFDGESESAPSLGKFAGTTIPDRLLSTGSAMFVKFYSDFRTENQGFKANYQTVTSTFCPDQPTYTEAKGTISDGSGTKLYGNNTDCYYLIQPSNADSIVLSFTAFNTEKDKDQVIVYDGQDTTGKRLAILSGTAIPKSIVGTSGAMYIRFISNETVRSTGWSFDYKTVVKKTAVFQVVTTAIAMDALAAIKSFNITANQAWTVVSDQAWLTISNATGNSTTNVFVAAEANTEASSRTATITISCNNEKHTIVVTQAGASKLAMSESGKRTMKLYPNPAKTEVTINIDESALVTFYSTDGKLVLSKEIKGKETISIEALLPGQYQVHIKCATEQQDETLIIK